MKADEEAMDPGHHNAVPRDPLSIVIVGASGDLAQRKILPALFALFCQDYLPERWNIFGFSRTAMSTEAFREKARENLACRYVPQQSCAEWMDRFLARCHYVSGQYDSPGSFLDLFAALHPLEGGRPANRMYYLAIPPSVFLSVAHALGGAGLIGCEGDGRWSRVVIEKPFGWDRESSDRMATDLARVFTEDQIYRIDHYLGKEIVQNLMVLRFANTVFHPLWSRETIESVQISWKENIGIGNRGGYFDSFGIIRDVMQNHLVQILALLAMEEPARFDPQHVRDEKVKALRAVPPLTLDQLVVGQYAGKEKDGIRLPAYTEEPGVPRDSITPTYAAAALRVENERWRGVPFLVRAGKALDQRLSEIRILFRGGKKDIFADQLPVLPQNQLVIRVQPDEAIYFRIVNKVPGLKLHLEESDLNLRYQSAFKQNIPDAYECLLLDALEGDKSLFIRSDELAASWDIFTPALHALEQRRVRPDPYRFGSPGPESAARLAEKCGARWL